MSSPSRSNSQSVVDAESPGVVQDLSDIWTRADALDENDENRKTPAGIGKYTTNNYADEDSDDGGYITKSPDSDLWTPLSRNDQSPPVTRTKSFDRADVFSTDDDSTPFAKTLQHFRAYRGQEASPSKSRRKASLPKEIADLAREAQEAEDMEELEKYREYDVGPLDPVMNGDAAGDLIMFNTPAKQGAGRDLFCKDIGRKMASPSLRFKEHTTPEPRLGHSTGKPEGVPLINLSEDGDRAETSSSSSVAVVAHEDLEGLMMSPLRSERILADDGSGDGEAVEYVLEIPGHFNDEFRMVVRTKAGPGHIARYIRVRAKELEAPEEEVEAAVQKFLENPNSFAAGGERAGTPAENPTFINVIGMLPRTAFWLAANMVAQAGTTVDALAAKLQDGKL